MSSYSLKIENKAFLYIASIVLSIEEFLYGIELWQNEPPISQNTINITK